MLLDHLGIHRAGAISPGVADADPMQLARGVLNVALARAGRALSKVRRLHSIRAIATAPRPQNIWKDGALIWKDAKNYLYARTTRTGRIIVGGEDSEKIVEPDARDRLIPEKSRVLAQRLSALWLRANADIAFGWSGRFDTTSDGLPLIGPVPGAEGVHAAYGYGGNGITFSFLAGRLIGDLIAGKSSPLLRDFALDRDGPALD